MDTRDNGVARTLRALPSVDELCRDARFADLPRAAVVRRTRAVLDALRERALRGELDGDDLESRLRDGSLVERIAAEVRSDCAMHHRRVLNATGIVLHTGIGRAPLAEAARAALVEAARHVVVEVDPLSGVRNERETAVAALLTELTGAEQALVVNNNAAAVNLGLRALAEGTEVVVSRGELVEIGGGFRMPDVMRQAGCRLVEVGATNRTHLSDYEQAIGSATGMLLRVHPSNFRILGFHSVPELEELAALGRRAGLIVFDDLGSGLLLDDPPAALRDEPTVRRSVRAGVTVCAFSGDKLLGGPQCGILVGAREAVRRCRAHPLYRAFRCDKLTLAALEATLRIYRDGDPLRELPALRAIAREPAELREHAERLCAALRPDGAEIVASESFVGSGANPARPMPSWAVALPGGAATAAALRAGAIPVFARVADSRCLLDVRTLADDDPGEVVGLVRQALARL